MKSKAKDYAFLLLKFRERSEQELRQRLKKKKFSPDAIEDTVSFLKSREFIDDRHFARSWINSRIKKPLGLRRIRSELSLKGVDKEIIDTQIEELRKDYTEANIVARIAKERLDKLKGIDPQRARKRVYAYLIRRGFSPETVLDVLNK